MSCCFDGPEPLCRLPPKVTSFGAREKAGMRARGTSMASLPRFTRPHPNLLPQAGEGAKRSGL